MSPPNLSSAAKRRRRRRKLSEMRGERAAQASDAAPPATQHIVNAFEDDVATHTSSILCGFTGKPVRDYAAIAPLTRAPERGDHLAWERLVLTSRFEPALVIEEGYVHAVSASEVELRLDNAFLPEIDGNDPIFMCDSADQVDLEERERERRRVVLPLTHEFRLLTAGGAARAATPPSATPAVAAAASQSPAASGARALQQHSGEALRRFLPQ